MNIKSNWTRGLLAAFLGSVVFMACEYKGPAEIWNPNQSLGVSPTISSVVPADSASGGVQEISLLGSHFSSDTSIMKVFFGPQTALIKSCSDTQVTVYRPGISGNDITIKVMVKNAFELGKWAGYNVSEAARLYGKLPNKNMVTFLAMDSQENAYIITNIKSVIKDSPQEIRSDIGTQGPTLASDFKVGPDGNLYIQERAKTQLYKIDLTVGGKGQPYAKFAKNVNSFDFDANGNIYGAGDKTGISVIKASDLSTQGGSEFQDVSVIGLRVFKGNVYANDSLQIWESPILSNDGTLGPKQSIFNIVNSGAYGTLANGRAARILSFEMADSGNLYVSINANGVINPILCKKNNGEISPLYMGILPSYGGQLVWGRGNWLYLSMRTNTASNDLVRIDMGEKGAPK